MWAVLAPAKRARLFHEYITAVRYFVRQEPPVSLWVLVRDEWESIAWQRGED